MLEIDRESTDAFLHDIDSMARAAHMWVRQQVYEKRFLGLPVSSMEELDLAAGFLAGLRTRLLLEDAEAIMLAYVYALMAGERNGARNMAYRLLARGTTALPSCSGYLFGLKTARELMESGGGSSAGSVAAGNKQRREEISATTTSDKSFDETPVTKFD